MSCRTSLGTHRSTYPLPEDMPQNWQPTHHDCGWPFNTFEEGVAKIEEARRHGLVYDWLRTFYNPNSDSKYIGIYRVIGYADEL